MFRPHPGDWEVVQIGSTGAVPEISSPQVRWLWICGQASSTGCGQENCPQGGGLVVHRQPTGWGTLCTANPHLCPLFGNETRALTGASESGHTKEAGWAVGNLGKAGDSAGEK
ncbi:hypothetical protein GCM10009730_05810 [Streptomyces albidochromogenes]